MNNTLDKSLVLHGLRVWQARKSRSITIYPVEEVRRAFAALPDASSISLWLRKHFPCLTRYTRIDDSYYLIEPQPPCVCVMHYPYETVEVSLS